MSQNDVYDVQRMFNHACAFVDCAKYYELESSAIEHRTNSHNVASVVKSAFACEVFIKALLVLNRADVNEVHGHELKDLWVK